MTTHELGDGYDFQAKVVAAWPGICPMCEQEGAFLMVHEDGGVTMRCPECEKRAVLTTDQQWGTV